MSNYKQTTVVGESWLRAKRIIIENPYNATKSVKFVEEKMFQLGEKILAEQNSIIGIEINGEEDMLKEINIIDPTTGEPSGETITFQEMYTILFSLYIQKAMERDYASYQEETEEPIEQGEEEPEEGTK